MLKLVADNGGELVLAFVAGCLFYSKYLSSEVRDAMQKLLDEKDAAAAAKDLAAEAKDEALALKDEALAEKDRTIAIQAGVIRKYEVAPPQQLGALVIYSAPVGLQYGAVT